MRRLHFARLTDRQAHHHLAITRLSAGQVTFAHTHDFPEIFLVTDGEGVHCWNGRELPVSRGSLAWVEPADRHHYRSGPEKGLEFINLALALWWWRKFARLFRPAMAPARKASGEPRGHRRLREVVTATLEHDLRSWLAAAPADPVRLVQLTAALVHALHAPVAAVRGAGVAAPDWLAKWQADLAEPRLVSEPLKFWQKRSGRSPEHLARSCRRFYGAAPTELISRARIAHVQARLRRGESKVAMLAIEAGFQNLGYFYRTFRRIAGSTPRAWLAAQAADAVVPR